MLDIHTQGCLQAACNEVHSVNDPAKTARVGRENAYGNHARFTSELVRADLIIWLLTLFKGWHLAEWSLSVVLKAAQLAFKASLFVFKESNPRPPICFFIPEDPKC